MNIRDKQYEIFHDYMDQFIYYLCTRCVRNTKGVKYHKQLPTDRKWSCHHDGRILNALTPAMPIADNFVKNFEDDIEHGIFHGIMTGFAGYILLTGSNDTNDLEYYFASALLHDFLKSSNYSQQDHDKELRGYFPNLLPETYNHSTDGDEKKCLIAADRLELRRYDDYKNWIDERYNSIINKLNIPQRDLLDFFYGTIRPSLAYLYKNRDLIFIRHGLESASEHLIDDRISYPPPTSYWEIDEGYAVEIDRYPFGAGPYLLRNKWTLSETRTFYSRCISHCSNHGGDLKYNVVKGFIDGKSFKDFGGKIKHSQMRDHLYATSNIKPPHWTFLFQGTDTTNPFVSALLKNNYKVIPQETVLLFYNLTKLIIDRLMALNLMH